jgi:hypothetical protein
MRPGKLLGVLKKILRKKVDIRGLGFFFSGLVQ